MKKQTLLNSFAAIAGAVALTSATYAQTAGEIDANFGTSGYVFTDHINGVGEEFNDMITLADDKIIMIGSSNNTSTDILLAKFNADGSVDNSFGLNGKVEIDLSGGNDELAMVVKELPDGRLLIGGIVVGMTSYDGFVMRLNSDGSINAAFGTNGSVLLNTGQNLITLISDLHVNADNSIFAAGTSYNNDGNYDFSIFKLTEDGVLDISFAASGSNIFDNGANSDELQSMVVTANGNIYLAGTSNDGSKKGLVIGLTSYGTINNSFNGTGKFIYDASMGTHQFNDIIEAPGNKLLIAGHEGTADDVDGIVLRLNMDGSLDNTFSSDGKQTSDIGTTNGIYFHRIAVTAGNRILITGAATGATMNDAYAMMLTETGDPEFDFAPGGDEIYTMPVAVNSISAKCMALQSDGSILIGGNLTSQDFVGENMFLFRVFTINTAGLNVISDEKSVLIYPNPASASFSIELKGQLVQAELLDLSGKVVQQWNGESPLYTLHPEVIDGTYLLRVISENGVQTKKLSVVR